MGRSKEQIGASEKDEQQEGKRHNCSDTSQEEHEYDKRIQEGRCLKRGKRL